MSELRRRLDDLMVRSAQRPSPAPATPVVPVRRALAEVVGGTERQADGKPYWHLVRTFDEICGAHIARGDAFAAVRTYADAAGTCTLDPVRTLVVDIETGGFAGTPVFLVGVVALDERPLCVHQFLARDYPEEEAILRAVRERAAARDTWITFNGKSFDEPFLRDRAVLHRLKWPAVRQHLDLLHVCRRQWRGRTTNFKLGTLEAEVLGRPRVGDIPSADVPMLFHYFIETRNAGPLRPVLEHNQLDLVACVELLQLVLGDAPAGR